MKYSLGIILCFFAGAMMAHAATAQNVIVNPGNASALASTTGISLSEAQNIINQASGSQISPEITIPAEGGTISGTNVVIRGIATPNASVDILIQPQSGSAGPTFGKAASDRYGVWSYTLAPQLSTGSYVVQATAQAGNSSPVQSKAVRFAVLGAGASSNPSVTSALGMSSDSYLIIILAIIISLTFIVTVIILATVPYARAKRTEEMKRTDSWETPELVSMDEDKWNAFVKQTETMRHYLKSVSQEHSRGRVHGPPVGAH